MKIIQRMAIQERKDPDIPVTFRSIDFNRRRGGKKNYIQTLSPAGHE